MKYTAYLGLGSNLASPAGSPEQTLRAAIEALGALGAVAAMSSLYRTAPVGYQDQPDFINAAAQLETDLAPEDLLRELLAVERRFGRDRTQGPPKGPRTLDLDLLLMTAGDQPVVQATATLTLPHPEMQRRRFVLEPLAEIAPGVAHPLLQKTMQALRAELPPEDGIRRVE